jgi:hypothetical protein
MEGVLILAGIILALGHVSYEHLVCSSVGLQARLLAHPDQSASSWFIDMLCLANISVAILCLYNILEI